MIGHKYTSTVGHTGSYAFGDHVRRNLGATVVELGIPPALAVGSVNVRMKSGFVLLVEAKGDDRDNSDSKQKLELGKIWESKSGSNSFGYFMVFDSNPLDNALSFDEFMARIKEL